MSAAAYTVDGRLLPRADFYAVACDPRRSVVVEACAGAGKTWMLVSRILRALLDGAAPHEILAITFTRKAAGEMRVRLSQWLAEFADPAFGDAQRVQALRERGLAAAEARALAPRLAGLHEQVLAGGRNVEIRTFHAWFSQLLRAAPMELLAELGLQAEMELLEELAPHAEAVMRRFYAVLLADVALRADHTWLVRRRGRSQVRKWLDAAWDKRIEFELADAAGTLVSSVPAAAALWPEYAGLDHPAQRLRTPVVRGLMQDAARGLVAAKAATARTQGLALEQALALDDDEACFEAAVGALFTDEGEPRKRLAAAGVPEAVALLAALRLAVDQQTAHAEHLCMVRLTRALLAAFAAYKRELGLADMADLERCALALLRDATLSGWVQERLDARVRHLLIDEFQDTSPLQWHALHAWLAAYAGAGGGASGQQAPAVFIVGDPKQSIYRFRRAEPRVFAAAGDFVVQGLGGNRLACDHTRRNAPEVLAAINSVFGQAQCELAYAGFRAHTTEVAASGQAAVLALPRVERPADVDDATAPPQAWRDSLLTPRHDPEEVLREREAVLVAAAVNELMTQRRWLPGEIQVLCRKHASLRLVAQALAALQLPFAAPEDFDLLESPEARDLVALLDGLASPQHALSLAQTLRSPLFGASDDDLIALATAAGAGRDWWGSLLAMPEPSAALLRARTWLPRWRQAAQQLPPHDVLDLIVAEGEVRERYAAALPAEQLASALAAIDALLEQAMLHDGGRHATPYNFVRALRRHAPKVPAAVRADAVQLLTIHGAKGLEARAVFVMDADPQPNNAETATLLVDWPAERDHPLRCAFVYSEARCPPSLAALLDTERAARRREELNGLYVAMSRAKELLVFSATAPTRRLPEPCWWQRVEAVAAPWLPVVVLPTAPLLTASPTGPSVGVLPPWTGAVAARPELATTAATASASTTVEDDSSSRLGQALHRVLEHAVVAGQGAARSADAVADIAALASAAAHEFAVDADEVARHAGRIWASPACARFFAGADLLWAGNEVSVSEAGEVLRIDRLVHLDAGAGAIWWVLDYKLHPAPLAVPTYREQLARYRRAVQRLEPAAEVRCAFITALGEVHELD